MTDAENTKPELPKNVRVRFCPSPTGTPHVGMIRTALFNWAEARPSALREPLGASVTFSEATAPVKLPA